MIHPPASDDAFRLLHSLRIGAVLLVHDGRLFIRYPDDPVVVLSEALEPALAECEDRGWVDNRGDAVVPTERGLYQLGRWEKSARVRRSEREQPWGEFVAALAASKLLKRGTR